MASALAHVDSVASSPERIRDCTERFCQTAKTYGFRGYGDTGYWSRRIKELAFTGTEYLTGVGFACGHAVNAAIAAERRIIVSNARNYAFHGYGDSDYWSDRCKELASLLFNSARKLERTIATTESGVYPRQRTTLDRRIMSFVAIARHYACRGEGDTDFWSRRAKALALEVGVFSAKVASTLGRHASAQQQQTVQRLLTSAKAYAFDGYGDGSYWRERCETLCSQACETGLALAVRS